MALRKRKREIFLLIPAALFGNSKLLTRQLKAELRTLADAFAWDASAWDAWALGLGLVFLTSLGVGHNQFNGPSKDVGRPDSSAPQGRQLREHSL